MNTHIYKVKCLTLACLSLLITTSCDPTSPEMSTEEYLDSDAPMTSWVVGINKELALCMGTYAELLDVATDNYRNVYSRSNREFDKPNILYTDSDVEELQRYVGKLRQMALYALNDIAPVDAPTDSQLQDIYTALTFSYILAGENFTAIPAEENGEPATRQQQLQLAIATLNEADACISSTSFTPLRHTLLARIYRDLGDKEQAVAHAQAAIEADATFLATVGYDEANSVVNNIKDRSYSANWWEPLPRLDFLDPKYQSDDASQCIAIAKAEEDYLILAEAATTDDALMSTFKDSYLHPFFELIASRGSATFTDELEMREYTVGDITLNLNTDEWLVRASEGETALSGLILNRATAPITVPAVSGTSVTAEQLNAATGDEFLQLVYLMRQEVFFAEGRRFADLGMLLPLCEVEAAKISYRDSDIDVTEYTTAYIPDYLPTEQYGMDDYTVDAQSHIITITHNLNALIVSNKTRTDIVPFE